MFQVDKFILSKMNLNKFTGHEDIMLCYINNDAFLINDCSKEEKKFSHNYIWPKIRLKTIRNLEKIHNGAIQKK